MTQNQIAYHRMMIDKDLTQSKITEENRKNLASERLKLQEILERTRSNKAQESLKSKDQDLTARGQDINKDLSLRQLSLAQKQFIKDTVLGSINSALSIGSTATGGFGKVASGIKALSTITQQKGK